MAKAQTTSENPQGEVSQQDTPVLPMQYDVRIHSIQFDGPCRATASLNINGCFAVRGVKLMEGSNGLFVSILPLMCFSPLIQIRFWIVKYCRRKSLSTLSA